MSPQRVSGEQGQNTSAQNEYTHATSYEAGITGQSETNKRTAESRKKHETGSKEQRVDGVHGEYRLERHPLFSLRQSLVDYLR